MGRPLTWDAAYGYELFLAGRTDREIADACRVKTSAVTSMRLKKWRKAGERGTVAPPETEIAGVPALGHPDAQGDNVDAASRAAEQSEDLKLESGDRQRMPDHSTDLHSQLSNLQSEGKEVAGVDENKKLDTARMMECIAKMTEHMGGIKAVCVGNIIQALWNLSSVDDIRDARAILDWLEENYDFG